MAGVILRFPDQESRAAFRRVLLAERPELAQRGVTGRLLPDLVFPEASAEEQFTLRRFLPDGAVLIPSTQQEPMGDGAVRRDSSR